MKRSLLLIELEHVDGLLADLDDRRILIIHKLTALKTAKPQEGNVLMFPNVIGITEEAASYDNGWAARGVDSIEKPNIAETNSVQSVRRNPRVRPPIKPKATRRPQ
jgi:hypothetical protein